MSARGRLFAVPPGAPFARAFAEGYHARYSPLGAAETAQIQILVNTSLARHALEEALADTASGPSVLPRLTLMSEFHADPMRAPETPLAIAPARRHLRLTRLVEQFLHANMAAGDRLAPGSMAADLAEALALLIDQFHDEGISPERLDHALETGALTGDPARHWETTLRFVDIVRKVWPAILAEDEGGRVDARARQRAAVLAQVSDWATNPPNHPIIVAASTGSVGSTAELMAGIAHLPQGAVILPGFDPATPGDIWDSATADHPLGPFRGLFALLDARPEDVAIWHGPGAGARAKLMAQTLRPAPVTDHWHGAKAELADMVPVATSGITLLEARSPQEEATAIAMAIRSAVELPERTVALVTPDAALARRVTAALDRFTLVPDDTMGQPLLQSPPGVLLVMVAKLATEGMDPVGLAALINHPLVQPGLLRTQHLSLARRYEREVLRAEPLPTLPDLPPWDGAEVDAQAWHTNLSNALRVLQRALVRKADLTALLGAHVEALEALTRPDPDTPPAIWSDNAGQGMLRALTTLAEAADAYGQKAPEDYPALLRNLLGSEQVRPKPRESHPRVAISGPREARMISADLVILAGLEDGTWPALPDPGPWLSRPMRSAVGLPAPERSVGLSAHDFLHGVCGEAVILSRAAKRDGAATVASRWLIRMETLIKGVGCETTWNDMQARGAHWCAMARAASRPDASVPRAARPGPNPPAIARPRKLSVTQIEVLVRDAYAIYAREVLQLRPLDPLGRALDARDRGNVLHEILETFVHDTDPWPGEAAARARLDAIADHVLQQRVAAADLRGTWRARLTRAAEWLIAEEAKRRNHASPIAMERRGRMELPLPAGPFEITAKADRIDRMLGGQGVVYDYKTGQPPSKKQVSTGMSHQLHLQAAILAAGGFDGLPAMPPGGGAYIGLTGSGDGGDQTEVSDLAETLTKHMDEVIALLSAYDAGAPYFSRLRPQFITFAGDYDHLARVAEWSDEDNA
ncbi:MAG: double-strand break repair protein AddB [Paracoccaceae bacterium]